MRESTRSERRSLRVSGVLAKIHVQDYGRITDAQLELRPFTVFIGPNNTNKTWVAYAIHGLVQSLSASRFFFRTTSAREPVSGFQPPPLSSSLQCIGRKTLPRSLRDAARQHLLTNLYRGMNWLSDWNSRSRVDFSIDTNGLARLLAIHPGTVEDRTSHAEHGAA